MRWEICEWGRDGISRKVAKVVGLEISINIEYNRFWVARLSGYDPSDYTGTSFDDVKTGEWYSAAVEWASTHGIVNGTGNRTFSPNDSISRKDMCVIMVRYCSIFGINLKSNSVNKFNDDSKISDYARDAVYIARSSGIVTGASGNMFNPKNTASRAEAAAVFMRFMINFADK